VKSQSLFLTIRNIQYCNVYVVLVDSVQ